MSEETMQLTHGNVHKVYKACLYRDTDGVADKRSHETFVEPVTFSRRKLMSYEEAIGSLVSQLPQTAANAGRELAWIDARFTAAGQLWTQDYQTLHMLVRLAVACGFAELTIELPHNGYFPIHDPFFRLTRDQH